MLCAEIILNLQSQLPLNLDNVGVMLQPTNRCNAHIKSVSKIISTTVLLLRNLKLIVSADVLISVYFAPLQIHIMDFWIEDSLGQ